MRRYPFELSGGQQQRVVIAMALAVNPHLLVLDEPTTGLDATVEAEILDLIEELRGRIHSAILLITHNLGLVARLCERVGVLYAGRLVEEGPARDVFSDPRHPYTMGLLRCVPRFGMNKGDAALQTIPGTLPALGEPLEGCVYSARCPVAKPVCTRREPDSTCGPATRPPGPRSSRVHAARPRRLLAAPRGAGRRRCPAFALLLCRRGAAYAAHDSRARRRPRRQGRGAGRRARDRHAAAHVQRRAQEADRRARRIAHPEARRDLRPGGRVGQRQDHAGQVRHRPDRRRLGRHHLRGQAAAPHGRPPLAGRAARHPDGLPEPRLYAEPRLEHARHPHALGAQAGRRARAGSVRAKVDKLSADVRVEPRFLLQKPMDLSGGQKQRIAIARAFAGDPTLVVCDEPASALDVSVQASILNLLVELQTSASGVVRVHQPRPRGGALHLRPHRRDVPGGADRGRLRRGGLQPAAPPLHRGSALVHPEADFDEARRRIALRGTMPSLSEPPSGCRFHTRCHRFLGDICVQQEPPLQEAARATQYKCHIPPDELLRLQVAADAATSDV